MAIEPVPAQDGFFSREDPFGVIREIPGLLSLPPLATAENGKLECEEYSRGSRLFRRPGSGPHRQLLERTADAGSGPLQKHAGIMAARVMNISSGDVPCDREMPLRSRKIERPCIDRSERRRGDERDDTNREARSKPGPLVIVAEFRSSEPRHEGGFEN